jgi:small subunit ribosomal protein S20
MRTSAKARLRNRADRARFRTAEKRVLETTDKTKGINELKGAYDVIDRMADKGVIHTNTAARHKARLARHVNRLSG